MIFDGSAILLVERAKEPLKGYWSLPGGIVETGEKLKEVIRREVREETGLEVETQSVFEIFERVMPDSVSRVEWVTEQNLPSYRLTEGTLGVIERAFAKLQR